MIETCTTIRENPEWQKAMIAYADACVAFDQSEEDDGLEMSVPAADMFAAYDRVADIIDRFFA